MENWELIAKYVSGEASESERFDLEQLLKTDPELEQRYRLVKEEWETSGALSHSITPFDMERGWETLSQKIKLAEENESVQHRSQFSLKWVYRVAAVLVVTLIPLWIFFTFQGGGKVLSVETGDQPKDVVLPDGSKVFLNTSSRIAYSDDFQNRKIELTGEAFFDVKHDPLHPFIVTNPSFTVKVIGTSFNVSSYPDQTEAVVTVSSGTVNFSGKSSHILCLTRGQSGKLDKMKQKLSFSDSAEVNALAWRTGQMNFNDAPLNMVSKVIRSYFGKEVILTDPALGNCRFTGTFNRPEEKEVIEVLKNTLSVKIIQTGKQIVISGKGC